MKWLPVKNNIERTTLYDEVPYFVDKGIDKTEWILEHYCGTDKTIFDNVPLTGSTVKMSNIEGTVRIGVRMINKLTPYADWTLNDLLKVNYIFSDSGEFYFVAATTVINGNSVEFALVKDLWMSKIDNVIVQDNVPRKVLRGHYNRFVNINSTTKSINTDLDNPNWKPTIQKEYNKITKYLNVFTNVYAANQFVNTGTSPDYTLDTSKNIFYDDDNFKYNFLNEFYWITVFVNLGSNTKTPASYSKGTKVIANGGSFYLPYTIYTLPVANTKYERHSKWYRKEMNVKIKNKDFPASPIDADYVTMLDRLTTSSSSVIGAVLTKGLFHGCSYLKSTLLDFHLKYEKIAGSSGIIDDVNLTIELTDEDIMYDKSLDLYGIPIETKLRKGNPFITIKEINVDDYFNFSEILTINQVENGNIPEDDAIFPFAALNLKRKLNTVFGIKQILPNEFFNVEIKNSDLDHNNKKNVKYEPFYYSKQASEITLNTPTIMKKLSYQYLSGSQPLLKKKSYMDNGIMTEKTHIINERYKAMSFDTIEIIEEKNNIFPTRTSAYNDYIIQNQSQRTGNIASASAEGSIGFLGNLLSGNISAAFGSAGNMTKEIMQIKNSENDLMRQPHQIKNLSNSIINNFIVDNNELVDYLTISQIDAVDMKEIWNDVYRNGCYWNFEKVINFSSRYWFNYWMIEDINKTIDVSDLHNDEIDLVRQMFMSGVRLWNIRSQSQKLNMKIYDLENLEYGRQ